MVNKSSFVGKVDTLIESISLRIQNLQSQKSFYHKRYDEILAYKDDYQKYQFELSRNNYIILKIDNEISKCELYLDRCRAYLKYIDSLTSDNTFLEKQTSYDFIKKFQYEAISYYSRYIKELDSRMVVERIGNLNSDSSLEKEKMLVKKERIYEIFSKGHFNIDGEKLYSNHYLNYDIDKVIRNLYEKKQKKAV